MRVKVYDFGNLKLTFPSRSTSTFEEDFELILILFIKIALKIESIINLLFLYHRVDVAL